MAGGSTTGGSVNELRATTLVDAVYASIRGRILAGELPGGSPLTELELARHYGVARPTAKAALERLVHEGLLRRVSNKTARVRILTVDDIRDLYFTRRVLEREIMMTLARRRHVPTAARDQIAALRRTGANSNVADVVGINIDFHLVLAEAVDSVRLLQVYRVVMGEFHLCMAQVQQYRLLSNSRVADEHGHILDLIAAGDDEAVAATIDTHLRRNRDALLDTLTQAGLA